MARGRDKLPSLRSFLFPPLSHGREGPAGETFSPASSHLTGTAKGTAEVTTPHPGTEECGLIARVGLRGKSQPRMSIS